MQYTCFLMTFFSFLGLTFSIPIPETISEPFFKATNTKNDTNISILTPRQVHTLPWPGFVSKWSFCQLGSWQGHQPQMSLTLWEGNCIEIGRDDYIPNLGEGGEFDFDSQLPYVVEVNKYPAADALPPYICMQAARRGMSSSHLYLPMLLERAMHGRVGCIASYHSFVRGGDGFSRSDERQID